MTEGLKSPVLADRMEEVALTDPERLAIVDLSAAEPRRLTYRAVRELTEKTARGLHHRGIRSGQVVAFQLPNWWEFAVLTLALGRIEAIACPLLPSFRDHEVRFMVQASGSPLYVAPEAFHGYAYADLAASLQETVPGLQESMLLRRDSNPLASLAPLWEPDGSPLPAATRADAPAQLLFTSGTTGTPKGVLHTHRTLGTAMERHARTLGLGAEDTVLVPSPMAHQTGYLYGMALAFYLGATAVYIDTWNPEAASQAIQTYGVRFIQAATPFMVDLTELAAPPRVPLFVVTGAAVPESLMRRARSRLGGQIVGAWGSTESGLVTVGRPDDPVTTHRWTDGLAMEGMEARVVEAETGQEVPPGEEGDFWVRTPALFTTYWQHPEWYQRAVTPEGFFMTGDLARQDTDGYVRITGRKTDLINRGGEKVPVMDVENLLLQHPGISDAALVAMPDPRLGERACAWIVPRPPHLAPTLPEVQAYLKDCGLAKPYWPERIEVAQVLPRTPSGKVQKFLLRQRLQHSATPADAAIADE